MKIEEQLNSIMEDNEENFNNIAMTYFLHGKERAFDIIPELLSNKDNNKSEQE